MPSMRVGLPLLLLVAASVACGPAGGSSGKLAGARPSGPQVARLDAGDVPPPPPPNPDDEVAPPPPPPEPTPPDAGFPDATQPAPPPPPDLCTGGPNKPRPQSYKIYYGTDVPQHVHLTAAQISAVGSFGGCSGLFIAP